MKDQSTAPLKRVCVFSGSRDGISPYYKQFAQELGSALVDAHLGLVYGGINRGLMGAIADAVLEKGGEVIGVVPETPFPREWWHTGLSELRVVPDLHARQTLMMEISDAFIALPGGFGTLEELFEVVLLASLELHQKPVILLNINNFFYPLYSFIYQMAQQGFLNMDVGPILIYERDINVVIQDILRLMR